MPHPVVAMETSAGTIRIELWAERAPATTENFLQYVDAGFYDGTIFHRVVPGFVIQGGGYTGEMSEKDTRPPIKNEADNGLKNERGAVSMARTPEVDSATSQFFINLSDNQSLDHGTRDFGYAVFGKVVRGMEIVDQIAAAPTGRRAGHQDVPMEPPVVLAARRGEPAPEGE